MLENFFIRAVTKSDLPMILSWRNHEEVRRHMFTQHEISLEEHSNWFFMAANNPTLRLMIVEDELGPFGYVQFSKVIPGGIADWGFYVRPDAVKGSGSRLGHAALNFAFLELGLHKVCGQAMVENEGSIAFHRKLGFIQEGVLRDQQRINDVYHSIICFGLLATEWQTKV